MIRKEVRYSRMTIREMVTMYNEHADKIDRPHIRPAPKDRGEMAKLLALILTYKPAPPLRLRDVAIQELCKVSHFEYASTGERIECAEAKVKASHDLISVGFPYAIVLTHIKARLVNTKVTVETLMTYATNLRKGVTGFKSGKLPHKRAYERKSDARPK